MLKIAVRVRETGSRIKLSFAANCPDARLFRVLVGTMCQRVPKTSITHDRYPT